MTASAVPNLDAFLNYASTDELSMVLRSHLALEVVLNNALSDVVPAGRTDLSRLPFMARVDLAIALGKVPDYLRPGYQLANQLRNRFAHRLDTAIRPQDAQELLSAFSTDVWDGLMFHAYQSVLTEQPVRQIAFAFATLFFHSATYAGLMEDVLGELLPVKLVEARNRA